MNKLGVSIIWIIAALGINLMGAGFIIKDVSVSVSSDHLAVDLFLVGMILVLYPINGLINRLRCKTDQN